MKTLFGQDFWIHATLAYLQVKNRTANLLDLLQNRSPIILLDVHCLSCDIYLVFRVLNTFFSILCFFFTKSSSARRLIENLVGLLWFPTPVTDYRCSAFRDPLSCLSVYECHGCTSGSVILLWDLSLQCNLLSETLSAISSKPQLDLVSPFHLTHFGLCLHTFPVKWPAFIHTSVLQH